MPTVRSLSLPLLVLALAGCSESKSRDKASSPVGNHSAVSASADARAEALKMRPGANGTGCPQGSTHVKREGNTVTFVFDEKFLSQVSQDKKVEIKDCTVVIPIAADKRAAFASFNLEGDVSLDKGAESIAVVDTYVQGRPDTSIAHQRQNNGPVKDALAFSLEVDPAKRAFTECGTGRALVANARVRLSAEESQGGGKTKFSKLTMVLEEKPCSDS